MGMNLQVLFIVIEKLLWAFAPKCLKRMLRLPSVVPFQESEKILAATLDALDHGWVRLFNDTANAHYVILPRALWQLLGFWRSVRTLTC